MKKLTLARSYLPSKTFGLLFDDEISLVTLERPWLNNRVNVSCIPEGVYYVNRDKEGRFKYYEVSEVEGRSGIEFHAGNFVEHSMGCILVGERFNDQGIANSNNAINELLSYIGDSNFLLNIRAANKDDFND